MKRSLFVVIALSMLLVSCSARQVTPTYEGLTAQKLISRSIDRGLQNISQSDLLFLVNHKVFIDWYSLSTMTESTYIKARLELELELHNINIVNSRSVADYTMIVFCTAAGTATQFSGFETPDMSLSAMPLPRIKVFGIDLYKGEFEFYYYLKDAKGQIIKRSEFVRGKAKSDKINLFTITIPINDINK